MRSSSRQLFICAAFLAAATLPGRELRAQRGPRSDEPRPALYRSADGAWTIDLPPAVEDALDRYDRDFEPWAQNDYRQAAEAYEFSPRQAPWAVIGDFNGDGRADVAIAGRNDRDALVVFILSTGRNKYRATEVEREPFDPDDPSSVRLPRLTYLYPGRYVVDDPRLSYPRTLLVEQPAVQITGGRRQGAVVYVVERNSVVPYYLSDRTAPPPDRSTPEAQAGKLGEPVALRVNRGISAAKVVPSTRAKKY